MHRTDSVVLVSLVLATVAVLKLAPTAVPVLLVALVRYRRAVR